MHATARKNARGQVERCPEVAAQAVACLISYPQNSRDIKRDEKSVPNLVQLLDPSPLNTAKKYAISCLLSLSSSKRCKKLMISHGAIGYLKKLSEMDVAGAKKLLERLERGKLRNLFSRNTCTMETIANLGDCTFTILLCITVENSETCAVQEEDI
uniref:Uncharacterized protein n=1 Tax=Ananas comosus var. bracteatus TaxID=296719 RepID=A0A6V7PX17_ANACO|nr:unnamed protein product [Ananas comosus var. bracteatus]